MANPATQGALQLARVLALALVTGPVILWAIGWVLTDGGTTSIAGADAPLTPFMALGIWAAVALPAFVSALWARRRAMDRAVAGEETRVLPLLIVAWALLEGAAILSGVFFLLVGDPRIVTLGVLVLVFGVVLTFPRPSWFPGG